MWVTYLTNDWSGALKERMLWCFPGNKATAYVSILLHASAYGNTREHTVWRQQGSLATRQLVATQRNTTATSPATRQLVATHYHQIKIRLLVMWVQRSLEHQRQTLTDSASRYIHTHARAHTHTHTKSQAHTQSQTDTTDRQTEADRQMRRQTDVMRDRCDDRPGAIAAAFSISLAIIVSVSISAPTNTQTHTHTCMHVHALAHI